MTNFPHRFLQRALLVALVTLLLASTVRATDWPQFRGPKRDGVWRETGLLKSFPADGLVIRWRRPVGWGWSSPVVARGRVFLSDSQLQKPTAKERLLCFRETTGEPLWTFAYEVTYPEWAFVPGQGGGPTATPIVEAGRVFMLGGNGHVHCLNARTGALLWQKSLGKEYQLRELQCRPSPLIEGNLLILFAGAKPGACVIALDKRTGEEVWKALDESVSNSSPLVIVAGGQRQLIVWTGESVTSLNPATGATYWREPMVTSNNDAIPTPVVEKNRLLIGGLMFELNADQPAASVLWPDTKAVSKRILSNTSTALLQGDVVFSAKSSGELVCLEARTGRQLWETNTVTRLGSGASIHLTPAGDAVFLFTDEGNLIRAQLTAQGYKEDSGAHLLQPTSPFGTRKCAWVPPAYANRHVFARNDEELVCASLGATR
ncbi:MAG: PQQ-like beta-propeller repeat protein [Verrucomicrobia bacterium]|nr:PQQ-like beta-propeller repeat protein [Verrucomicrobiota bacterium]